MPSPTACKPIRIIIADEHPFFIEGLKTAFAKNANHLHVTGEATNGRELLYLVKNMNPDITITAMNMTVSAGLPASFLVAKQFPRTQVLILSETDSKELMLEALESGAKGFLMKQAQASEIINAIETLHRGELYYTQTGPVSFSNKGTLHNSYHPAKKNMISFSETEIKVIQAICTEMTIKEIAGQLFMSTRTIEECIKRIKEKIEAKNSVGIALYALKNNLISGAHISRYD